MKLTQLGLDLDREFCYANLAKLIEATPPDKTLWIDMEQSPYVDVTLKFICVPAKRIRTWAFAFRPICIARRRTWIH